MALRAEAVTTGASDGVMAALTGAANNAIEIPEAAVEIVPTPAAESGEQVPRAREIRELGTFFATRIAGLAGQVVFCPSAAAASSDLSPSVAIGLVAGEVPAEARELIAERSGLFAGLEGHVVSQAAARTAALTIFDRWSPAALPTPPASFRVLAVVTAYNESDVIVQTIGRCSPTASRFTCSTTGRATEPSSSSSDAYGERVTRERFPAERPEPDL